MYVLIVAVANTCLWLLATRCTLSKVYFLLLLGNLRSFSLESPVHSWHLYNTTKTYSVILSVGSDYLKRLVHTV